MSEGRCTLCGRWEGGKGIAPPTIYILIAQRSRNFRPIVFLGHVTSSQASSVHVTKRLTSTSTSVFPISISPKGGHGHFILRERERERVEGSYASFLFSLWLHVYVAPFYAACNLQICCCCRLYFLFSLVNSQALIL